MVKRSVANARSIAESQDKYQSDNNAWRIACPAHGGDGLNLQIWDDESGYLRVKCWSNGCSTEDILRALNIPTGGASNARNNWRIPSPTATYAHPDGVPRNTYRVNYPEHFEHSDRPCGFSKCGKIEPHKHLWSTKGRTTNGTYLLLWTPDSPSNHLVFVEGEKSAAALKKLVQFTHPNMTVVSWYGGASSWNNTSLKFTEKEGIDGRNIILWPDADDVGRDMMSNMAARMQREGSPNSIAIVDTKDLAEKMDAADVDYDTAVKLLSNAKPYEYDDPIDGMEPLLDSATKEDLGGGDTLPKLRDAIVRKAATTISHRFISLFGQWYQRVENRWQLADEEYIGRELSMATIDVSGYALSKYQKGIASDRLRDVVYPDANNIAVLPKQHRMHSFNMDTGEIIHGVAYNNTVVSVNDSGDISTRTVDEREFFQSTIWYDLPDTPQSTPMFDEFLHTSLSSEEDGQLLMELVGRTLCGRRDEQVIAILQGPGGSGKGTMFNLLSKMLDTAYGSATSFEAVSGRFGTAKMAKKLAYVFTDVKPAPGTGSARDSFLEGAAIIKAISGGDYVDIEIKNVSQGSSAQLPCAIWVATNFAPRWVDGVEDAEAWRRRMCPVIFETSVPDELKIAGLADKMFEHEGPNIAMKCIQAFADAVSQGAWPQLTERAQRHLASWIDSAKGEQVMFVETNIVHTGNSNDVIINNDLYAEYAFYAGLDEVKGASAAGRALTRALRDTYGVSVGAIRIDGRVVRGFKGIRLVRADDMNPQQTGMFQCKHCGDTNPAAMDTIDTCAACNI